MWVNIQRITRAPHCANVVWPDLEWLLGTKCERCGLRFQGKRYEFTELSQPLRPLCKPCFEAVSEPAQALRRLTSPTVPASSPRSEEPRSSPSQETEDASAPPEVRALAKKLKSSDERERYYAIFQLGLTGSAAAVPPLLKILSEYGDDEFRRENLMAIEKCSTAFRAASAGASIAEYVEALKSKEQLKRLAAVVALGLVGDERVIPHLAAGKTDEVREVRLAAEIAWNRLPQHVKELATKAQAAEQRKLGRPPLTVNRTVAVVSPSSKPTEKVVWRMMFTPDGNLAVGVGGKIHLIEPKTLRRLREIAQGRGATGFDINRSGRLIAVGSRIYDVDSGALRHELSPPVSRDVVFAGAESDLLAVYVSREQGIKVYTTTDWREVGTFPVPEGVENMALMLAPDHVVCQGFRSITVFSARSQNQIWSAEAEKGVLFTGLCVSPDGYVVVAEQGASGSLWVFDPQGRPEGKLRQRIYVDNGGNGVFTPDARYLLVPSGGVKLCDWRSREQLKRYEAVPGIIETTTALAISADGAQMFSASTHGDITEWI